MKNGCTNLKLGVMLHHYELGLLSDKDRELFVQHILECEFCYSRIQSLADATKLMTLESGVKEVIRDCDEKESDDTYVTKMGCRFWGRIKPVLKPSFVLALLVLFVLILKNWQFEIHPTQEASASENRLMITQFENLIDPDDSEQLGEIIRTLLISDLTESRYMDVVSNQRLNDVLRSIGVPDPKSIDQNVISKAAKELKAKWILEGRLVQIEPQICLATHIIDAISGDIKASQEVVSLPDEDIFTFVDRLTLQIKSSLSLPDGAHEEKDPSIADMTTFSKDAYRSYLQGLEYQAKFYFDEAKSKFLDALKFDSTFTLAYYRLARQGEIQYLDDAVRLSNKVGRSEKKYIEGLASLVEGDTLAYISSLTGILDDNPNDKDALMLLGNVLVFTGDYRKAINCFNNVIALDYYFKEAYNSLAYAYNSLNDPDSSIWAINQYIKLAPDEANPYDTRGDLYADNGKLQRAIESYRSALSIKPDYYISLEKLAHMYIFSKEYNSADSCYRTILNANTGTRIPWIRCCLSFAPMHQGRFKQALKILEEGIQIDSSESAANGISIAVKHRLRAIILMEMGKFNQAVTEINKCMEIYREIKPNDIKTFLDSYIWILGAAGEHNAVDSVLNQLKEKIKSTGLSPERIRIYEAVAQWYRGDIDLAVLFADDSRKVETIKDYFPYKYFQARIFLDARKLDVAVAIFEELLKSLDYYRLYFGIQNVKIHYYLGMAYELSGWNSKAAEQYEIFLDLFSNREQQIEEFQNAKERLKLLKNL